MIQRTINILTSHTSPHKTCVMGNEGIARAALEAGVNGVFAYPGTPSTEISEIFNHVNNFQTAAANKENYPAQTSHPVYFEYSINEKIALEKAIAYSIGNRSAMCVMKNVGMNVASDPLMSITYQTIVAPLVIVVCDDPGCHSSSNEQDSRYWGPMASVPVFNPATPADAFEMIKQAFLLSEKIKLPVIVRTTTRVSHTRGIVTYGELNNVDRNAKFDRLPEHINIPARTASAHVKLLEKLKSGYVLELLKLNSKIIDLSPSPSSEERGVMPNYFTADSFMWNLLHDKALTMRKNPTVAENALWQSLRRNATNFHFRRQHIIDKFIADFVCIKKRLVVEVDGDIHDYQQDEDELRTQVLNRKGFKVIRFRNEEVINNTELTVEKIITELNTLPDYKVLSSGEDLGEVVKLGIISSGVATSYVLEILHQNDFSKKVNLLDLGLIHPFPEKEVLSFLKKDFEKIIILEELDAFVENAVRNIAQKNNLKINILGKGFSGLSATGEFSIDLITKVLEEFSGTSFEKNKNIPLENSEKYINALPARPPALCAGCPHRATYYLLKLAIPRDQSELIMCGDIGCFGLGALPPLRMIDTVNHMGMSISMAQGLYESFHDSDKSKKVVALVGDGTFFHSGLSSLVNAIYTRANILVIIFDNRTIGMTGHQAHPGASTLPKYHQIEIPPLLKGLGVEVVETIDPFNIRENFAKVNKVLAHQGVSVLVSKSPCIFLPEFKENMNSTMKIVVDPDACNTCANHEDVDIACSRCYAPKSNLSRAKAKLTAEISIPGEEQLCPANICNHGFFNSILEGDYKSAVEIVRDKMLFARTCGDICHRPCELFSNENSIVPIKKLKHLVAAVEENFRDFSVPIKRAKEAVKKNKSVAIIGAGPAGLSAAYDLVQVGYQVTIFEKENKAGGMVTSAIPSFRMDKSGFDYEAMQLEKMGVKFNFNTSLGKEISLEKLSKDFDSVLLAIGMNKAKKLELIENNVPAEKKIDALSFLSSYNKNEKIISDGSVVLVIGGGNSAMDAARSAKKLSSKNRIIVSCIETQSAMPAFAEEIKHVVEEGIELIADSEVKSCALKNGKIDISLVCSSTKKYLQDFECDFIITAIGQTTESAVIEKLSKDDDLRVKSENSFTGFKNVFVAGDLSSGNNMSVIGAIASGKKAVVAIRKALENYQFAYEGEKALHRLNTNLAPTIQLRTKILEDLDEINLERFNLFQSCQKCNHCIDNFGCPAMVKVDGKVQIDDSRCTLCGLCIDVCPNNAIRWEVVEKEVLQTEKIK